MWYVMAQEQRSYNLSERLIRAITSWHYNEDGDVEEIIQEGADVNRLHGTLLPLHCACMTGDVAIVQLLIEHGAQVGGVDGYGRVAVHYAAERSPHVLDLLVNNGANVRTPDANQATALHWASFKNKHQCVRMLLRHGANVDAIDHNNDTAISWAAMKGNLESVKVLLEYNARVDIVNYEGKSPILRICNIVASGLSTKTDDETLNLLLQASGQFTLRANDGQLPRVIANDNRLSDMLMSYCDEPRSLQDLCRVSIRRQLGASRYLPNVARNLPVPLRLQNYILLQRS